jgi:hypothetical protein
MNDFSRRRFLKGVSLGAGATFLGPILDSLEAQAAGKVPASARRVVFMIESNGLFPHHVQPKGLDRPKGGADKLIDLALDKYELSDAISPLAPFKNQMTLIQGLSGRICEGSGGHSTNYGGLGFYSGNVGPVGQTIDCAIADVYAGPIPHVGLGIQKHPDVTVHYSVSATAPGKPLPIHCKPDLSFIHNFDNSNVDGPFGGMRFAPGLEAGFI